MIRYAKKEVEFEKEATKEQMSTQYGGSVQVVSSGTVNPSSSAVDPKEAPKTADGKDGKRTAGTRGRKRDIMDENKQAVAEGVALSLVPQHSFGSLAAPINGVQSYSTSGRAASSDDRDTSERLVFRVGRRICVFDPTAQKQRFFTGRATNVTNILHFSMAANAKYIALCESVRSDRAEITTAQASIFNTTKLGRVKTLSTEAKGEYVCSAWCENNKYLACLLEGVEEREVHIWSWEKEKIFKSVSVGARVTKIGAALGHTLVTTSGVGILKSWYVAADSSLKADNLLPPAKEMEHSFSDHLWLPHATGHHGHGGSEHRMLALGEHDPSLNPHTPMTPGTSLLVDRSRGDEGSVGGGSTLSGSAGGDRPPRQALFVFDGLEQPKTSPNAPIDLQLKSTIPIKNTLKVDSIAHTSKGVVLVGLSGAVVYMEKTDDSGKREAYVEMRSLVLHEMSLLSACTLNCGDSMIVLTATNRLLNIDMAQLTSESVPTIRGGEKGGGGTVSADSSVVGAGAGEGSTAASTANSIECTDLFDCGFHGVITAASIPRLRTTVVTISSKERCARVWSLSKMKCEFVHEFRQEEPVAVGVHPTGSMCLVSFKDRVKLYNILMDSLQEYRELILKGCQALAFSNGGQYFAAAANINVNVFDTNTMQPLATFQGHMMTVKVLVWSAGDDCVFSSGVDGNVYGWPLRSNERLDMITSGARKSQVSTICVETFSNGLFSKDLASQLEGGADINKILPMNRALIATSDGHMRAPAWVLPSDTRFGSDGLSQDKPITLSATKMGLCITSMAISKSHRFLFAGTSVGSLRVYNWPPSEEEGEKYIEYYLHSSAVVSVLESMDSSQLTTCGADGAMFVFKMAPKDLPVAKAAAATEVAVDDGGSISSHEEKQKAYEVPRDVAGCRVTGFGDDSLPWDYNDDVVAMSNSDMEDHVNEVIDLQKRVTDLQGKFTFEIRNLEYMHGEASKKNAESHAKSINEEKEKFDMLQKEFDSRVKELLTTASQRDIEHQKLLTETENQYEHKLAVQVDRFDRLSEDMEVLKQRCEGLLVMERKDAEKRINDLKTEARNREKRLKGENKRIKDEKGSDEGAFKEILDQQEDEYEDELRQLIGAAEAELTSERETIVKLRTLVQTKNTKLDQMRKKLMEISQASKARLALLQNEKKERQKLQDTIDHYKKNLMEREAALAEKETVVLELRNTTRTLENFRFVLDSRLQQLSAERGPITSHIEDLENHISQMYEELVTEFDTKKRVLSQIEVTENKLTFAQQECENLRSKKRQNELYISSFKRELGNVVSGNLVGKDLEDEVRNLYKKYVKGEEVSSKQRRANEEVHDVVDTLLHDDDDSIASSSQHFGGGGGGGRGHTLADIKSEVEIELLETAREADRQKKFVERSAKNLQHRLKQNSLDSMRTGQRRLMENAALMYECNDLRADKKKQERRIFLLEEKINKLEKEAAVVRLNARLAGKSGYAAQPSDGAASQGEDDERSRVTNNADDMSSLGGSINQRAMESVHRVKALSEDVPAAPGEKPGISDAAPSGAIPIPSPSRDDDLSVGGESLPSQPPMRPTESAPLLQRGPMASVGPAGGPMHKTTSAGKLGARNTSAGAAVGASSGGALRARMTPGGSGKGKTPREQLALARMAKEVELLMEQLDEAHREREMQRHEIARLRHNMVSMAGIQPPSRGKIVSILEQTFPATDGDATGRKIKGTVLPRGNVEAPHSTQSHGSLAALSVDNGDIRRGRSIEEDGEE